MPTNSDLIADCVLRAYRRLPAKFKPRSLANGRHEWIPIAGIVISQDVQRLDVVKHHDHPINQANCSEVSAEFTCVALATGMKCLPANKLHQSRGNVLHDWHAEVLAIRAFNRWILDECNSLVATGQKAGSWLRQRSQEERMLPSSQHDGAASAGSGHSQPFAIRDDVKMHMYCSQAPCGDASMELIMSAQEDSTPWLKPAPSDTEGGMHGRGHFDQLGIVRRKPARPDAPVTLSKSCSDKLAMRQCTGLLSSLTSLIVHPSNAYLETLVIPDSQLVASACDRAFGPTGRMAAIASHSVRQGWTSAGYRYQPFTVEATSTEFEFSKQASQGQSTASNISTMWTPNRREVLINGVLQGRRQFDANGASCVSRAQMWKDLDDLVRSVGWKGLTQVARGKTYADVKRDEQLRSRELVKRQVKSLALKPWKQNAGDEDWGLTI